MNILIFSVSIGNGHDQVAHTLRNEFIAADNSVRVKIVNTINFISPLLDKFMLDSYLNILKFYPKAWGKIYEKTNKMDPIIDINDITNKLMTSKLRKSIINFNPDVIICTHSFPSVIISNIKQRRLLNIPLISVVTDFNIHTSWVTDLTDEYVIPHENLCYVLESYGVPSKKILPFGIPIKRDFVQPTDKNEIRQRLRLEDKTTVLVMGGGLGLGQINNIVKELDKKMEDVQIIAIAGRNTRLENRLKRLDTKNKLVVFGFVSNVHELMEVSDCVVTKPGGLTTAEILSKKKPLVIFSPLPGQEYENAEFLLNSGVAAATSDVGKIPILLNQILKFDTRLKCMKEIATILRKPYAGRDVVAHIIKKYGNKS